MTQELQGERKLEVTLETFPEKAKQKIRARMAEVINRLAERTRAATPKGKTGQLEAEITGKVYADSPHRVAGYVSVVAHSEPKKEYPKAASLEYGIKGTVRKVYRKDGIAQRLGKRRIVDRVTRPVVMRAYRYLRDPMEESRGEAEAALREVIEEAMSGEGEQ